MDALQPRSIIERHIPNKAKTLAVKDDITELTLQFDRLQLKDSRRLEDLPSVAYDRIAATLDEESIANLRLTARAFRDEPALKALSLSASLQHAYDAFQQPKPGIQLDDAFMQKNIAKCSALPSDYRKFSIVELLNISHLEPLKNNVAYEPILFHLMKPFSLEAKSEVLQDFIESISIKDCELRTPLFDKVRKLIDDPRMPNKSALYASLANSMLYLDEIFVRLYYPDVKKSIIGLNNNERTLPTAHLARVLHLLEPTEADEEFEFFMHLVDPIKSPSSISILNGLLRGSKQLNESNHDRLLHRANSLSSQSLDQGQLISHMHSRAEFIKIIPIKNRCSALQSSLEFCKQLKTPEAQERSDVPDWKEMAVLPLALTIPFLPKGEEMHICSDKLAGLLVDHYNASENSVTFKQRYDDYGERFSDVVDELINYAEHFREQAWENGYLME